MVALKQLNHSKETTMKNFICIICASIFFVSCKSGTADQEATENDSANAAINYAWVASLNDTTGKMEFKKSEATALDSLSPASVIDFINSNLFYGQIYALRTLNFG